MTGVEVLIAVAVPLVLFAFDRLMLAFETRGWVRWRRSPPTRASANTALLEILSIYEPAHQHVVEERRASQVDEIGDDDPLGPPRPLGRGSARPDGRTASPGPARPPRCRRSDRVPASERRCTSGHRHP